jgi:hypothetical protein
VPVGELDDACEREEVGVDVWLAVPVGVLDDACERVDDCVELGVTVQLELADSDMVCVGVTTCELESVPVPDELAVDAWDELWVGLGPCDDDAVGLRDRVNEGDCVPLCDTVAPCEAVTLDVDDGVLIWLGDELALRVTAWLGVCVAVCEGDCEPERVPVPLAVSLWLAVAVTDGVWEAVCEGVAVRVKPVVTVRVIV